MDSVKNIYIDSIDHMFFTEEQEGYICKHVFDEETQEQYYYTSKPTKEEVLLTNQYLLEQTGVDYKRIEEEFEQSQNKQAYIDTIEEPLVKYRLQHEYEQSVNNKHNLNNDSNISHQQPNFNNKDLVRAKVLLTLNLQYHKNELETLTKN